MTMNKYFLVSAQMYLLSSSRSHAWISSPWLSPMSLALRSHSVTSLSATSSSSSSSKQDPVQMARLRLEMHWNLEEHKQADECIVEDPSTCGSEECLDCQGEGETLCRFCRGTSQLYVGGAAGGGFRTCPICQQGHEVCTSCRGTGWIAEWTTVPQQLNKLKNNNNNNKNHGEEDEERGFNNNVGP